MDPNEPWAEPSNFDKNCPRSCPQKIVQSLKAIECETSTDPVLLTEPHSKLLMRKQLECSAGDYALDWNGKVLPNRIRVVLADNTDNAPGEHNVFFTNAPEALRRLDHLDFFKTIREWNYMTIDVEGVTTEWKHQNAVPNPRAAPFSVFHCADPKGVILVVHCLFDGRSFKGRSIPHRVLELLADKTIVKKGSGVSEDLAQLYQAAGNRLKVNGFGPTLEMSSLMLFLYPVEEEHFTLPKTGMTEAYRKLGLGHLMDEKSPLSIKAVWHGNQKRVYDYTKNPRLYTKKMILYNDGDVLIPLALLDLAVLKLCEQYQFDKCPDADVSFPRLALIALLMHSSAISCHSDAVHASKFKYAPTNLFDGYNPFNMWKIDGPYADPEVIMNKLRGLIGNRRLPFLPMIHHIRLTDPYLMGYKKMLRGYTDDEKIVLQGFQARTPSHRCIICGAANHSEEECEDPATHEYRCKYPLCDERNHKTYHCPSMTQRCSKCKELGHDESRHFEENFDVLSGLVTTHYFARKHQYLNIINAKEVASKIFL